MASAMESHSNAVTRIASIIRGFHDSKSPFRIYHGSTNSTRRRSSLTNIVDISGLDHVLFIDQERKTALVEPNVSMDTLVQHTLAHQLIPLVVMEFRGITVGGGFSGTSGESSSFKYGFFDRTVRQIEIILGNGERVNASRTERSDLFWSAASSFGTMGVVTLLEVQLREVGPDPHLELQYLFANSMDAALKTMQEAMSDPESEYIDGIMFNKGEIVICRGRVNPGHLMARTEPVRRFARAGDEWFYIHAERQMRKAKASPGSAIDYIPLEDYLFRYDRGGFWGGKYCFQYFFVPFTRWTRWLLSWFMGTSIMYHALHESGLAKQYIVQDVGIPYGKAAEFGHWLDDNENFGYYPPLALSIDDNTPEILLNFGIWGPGPTDRLQFISKNRKLEQKVSSLGGRKWLYAHTYYTEEEFWSIYDRKQYDAQRKKYFATDLPSIYEKVKMQIDDVTPSWYQWAWSLRPFAGLYGAWKAIRGGDYLAKK
ncbi:hypothetical protein N7468_001401 [Penicillium chermesinum]|uniref:Delta(24)-sterol reductase n=1 Tax=Penicillium chermesinum TaxID=63820 RepID=A0A9W9PIS0_9EURO|nr:uncharacterized protein N7468_001401 [Penicillium chermesinum]KAJ5246418.1 hypothetical protein N7468_001401 [Penicillium chermesinum]